MYSDANWTLTMDERREACKSDTATVTYASPSRDHDDGGPADPGERMAQTPTNHSCPHQGLVAFWKSKYEEAQCEIIALRVRVISLGQRMWLNNEYCSASSR